MQNRRTLIFVYRANRGFFNAMTHTLHRVFSPETYECRLCHLTASPFGNLRSFKKYLESRPEAKVFYHRKEFQKVYRDVDQELPLILLLDQKSKVPHILLDRADIESCHKLSDLIEKLDARLECQTENAIPHD